MYKGNVLATTLALSTLSFGLIAGMPAAQADSLVPQQEGEIHLKNIGCIVSAANCIDTTPMGYTIQSLPYDTDGQGPQYGLSRLFVDQRTTTNDWGFGIKFGQQDAGTNPSLMDYWLRPVAYTATSADAAPSSTPTENGQLEIGKFLFEFTNTVSDITLDFFDVEDSNFSGIVAVNGNPLSSLLPAGPDGNVQSLKLSNVNSFVVQLGKPGPNSVFSKTGDGVNLRASVPEPGATAGLAALALAGILSLRQRQKTSELG